VTLEKHTKEKALMPSVSRLCFALPKWTFILCILFLFNCDGTPLQNGRDTSDRKIIFYNTIVTPNSATVTWLCSVKSIGTLIYGLKNPDTFFSYGNESIFHTITLSNLPQTTTYKYYLTCGEFGNLKGTSIPLTFTTLTTINDILIKQSIWILGGTSNGNPVAPVDVYDPVNNAWYPTYTSIPTPRVYAGIVSNNGKIYVMGGMIRNANGTFSVSNLVEEYTPTTNTWATMTNMPSSLQGFVAASVGQDIYLLAGTTTTDMITGTTFNSVFKFSPSIGTGGTWTTRTSQNSILARVDMAGCAIDGNIFFTTGRFYSDGSAQSTSDSYVVSANGTTSIMEAPFTGRHGAGSVCYRPTSTDPNPSDSPMFIVAGGSTLTNLIQPVTATTDSSIVEYYIAGGINTLLSAPVLPSARYMPAMEISYQKRAVYVFGGSSQINAATNTVYSLVLGNPIISAWTIVNTTMPIARFGHKAVILDR
jgi:N-acetylneuraminic acid mutarotase